MPYSFDSGRAQLFYEESAFPGQVAAGDVERAALAEALRALEVLSTATFLASLDKNKACQKSRKQSANTSRCFAFLFGLDWEGCMATPLIRNNPLL